MEYKMTMPQLTDTMEEGKIVRWLKKEGDYVKKNEPIVEIESDKAVIEVPSMREGILKKILAEEGEELPVGAPIAIIETEARPGEVVEKKEGIKSEEEKKEIKPTKEEKEEKKEKEKEIKIEKVEVEEVKLPEGTASPAARKLARELGLDLKKLQKEGKIPTPAHEEDIKKYFYESFFTKTALDLLKEYNLDPEEVYKNIQKEKIDVNTLKKYILENNIPQITQPSDIQSILIKNLSKSTDIPAYHIKYQYDFSPILKTKKYTVTTYLIKILGDIIQDFPKLRTIYKDGKFYTYPSSNISVAVAVGSELFNPTIKNVESKTLQEIYDRLQEIRKKAAEKRLGLEDIQGGTFSISNLGMYGIKEFDAVIPPFQSAIAAIGKAEKGIITVVFTFDHRVINGAEAAEFVVALEKKLNDKKYISSLK